VLPLFSRLPQSTLVEVAGSSLAVLACCIRFEIPIRFTCHSLDCAATLVGPRLEICLSALHLHQMHTHLTEYVYIRTLRWSISPLSNWFVNGGIHHALTIHPSIINMVLVYLRRSLGTDRA
jgi:hypothetical protein